MKFQPDVFSAPSIKAYGPDWVALEAQERIHHSVVIVSHGKNFDWKCARFEELTEAHFALLAQLDTELVVFGSGTRLRFPAASLTRSLIERQIGIESMDTQAACRTYNILAGEGRKVVAALLLESPPG